MIAVGALSPRDIWTKKEALVARRIDETGQGVMFTGIH